MATYAELFDLQTNSALRNRVAVAGTIKAKDLIGLPSPTSNQLNWANAMLLSPLSESEKIYRYVLASNASATVAQINAVSDATLQTAVNTAADALIAGGVV